MKTIYSLPVEGGCPKGRGLAEGKESEANLHRCATSFPWKGLADE